MSWAKLIVVVAVIGAAAFGLFLGYLAYTNDSFPTQEKPFAEYASVVATNFNGTEFYLKVQWTSTGNFTPFYAQLTSPTTDAANTPVCSLGITSVVKGQIIDLPFKISAPRTSVSSVDLAIAVRSNVNMTEFTIVYHVDQVTAQPGNIYPSAFACEQPQGSSM
ncbi:MAG: hypothetical protein LYZ69_04870 [Nitrososphaerales archaeon]|nr:hypothetical protein [Nitrososphaerales archaeon]